MVKLPNHKLNCAGDASKEALANTHKKESWNLAPKSEATKHSKR
jgi:hypothetical protein